MLTVLSLSFLLIPSVLSAPAAVGPTVRTSKGIVVGQSANGVDSFYGIPFALPPVGPLRLKPPQPITASFDTFNANPVPKACPQFYLSTSLPITGETQQSIGDLLANPIFQAATLQSEDCLTVNVQRPAGTNANQRFPVLVWIYGGGFEFGSTQNYQSGSLINRSMEMENPMVYVSINYRVGAFGFLHGKELSDEGSTNLGLRDQRLGLQWVAENIGSFGGDPDKVTIWGESAGSISVFDHTIINGGDHTHNGKPLFRGAIMNSGSIVPAQTATSPKAQAIYDTLIRNAGCLGIPSPVLCLRNLPYDQFLRAANSLPAIFSYRSLDLTYIPRPDPDSNDTFFSTSPEQAVATNAYAKIPIIVGDVEDEGTLFSIFQFNLTTTDQLIDYISSYFPSANRTTVATLVSLYPDDPAAGSPYNTGAQFNFYPQYKRLAAILGDFTFTLTRRVYLNAVAPAIPSWSFLADFLAGTPLLGTYHASDVDVAYGDGFAADFPATETFQERYVSFVASGDPEAVSLPGRQGRVAWPRYQSGTGQLLGIGAQGNRVLGDDFRKAAGDFLAANVASFKI
ncbi:putative extracellular lipase [Aulographum hederae CBS 113979]|uniref:Carboxylic ester hydrolase n=1 Tax=Aulographum hederae CBS 113979 TaxID=1176131 RepID=A0A6G1H690_9PEZI|nr:putative extracellular lipase [Aulographum hederae CBS 113979]